MEGRTCGNVVVMISASACCGRTLLPLQILDGAGPEIDEVRRHASAPYNGGILTSSTGLSRWIPTPSRLGSRRTELRFTVRRPASAEVSPCCHRPSGGDVACGVHVCVARPRAAGDALENRLALPVFRRDMPATGASLRRIRCRDELEAPRGLVRQPGHQQSPALAADLTIEATFLRDASARVFTCPARRAGHRAHLQILDT